MIIIRIIIRTCCKVTVTSRDSAKLSPGRRVSTMWQGYNRHTMHYKEVRIVAVAARCDQCNDRFMPSPQMRREMRAILFLMKTNGIPLHNPDGHVRKKCLISWILILKYLHRAPRDSAFAIVNYRYLTRRIATRCLKFPICKSHGLLNAEI